MPASDLPGFSVHRHRAGRLQLPSLVPPDPTPPVMCPGEPEVRADVARYGREHAWLAPRRTLGWCIREIVAEDAIRSRGVVCLGRDIVRAVALCVYGHEVAVLFAP